MAVFLPAYGRHGAALLRIHNIAEALRQRGWRTLVVPWTLTLAQRHRVLAKARPDILVMQGARHALNRPAYYPQYPVVFDMDDADFHLPHLSRDVTEAMPQVRAVIAGSSYVAEWCRGQGAPAHVVWTGAPVSRRARVPQADRPRIVAWAQTAPATYVAEAEFVLEVMQKLSRRVPNVRFRLYDRKKDDPWDFASQFDMIGLTTEWHRSTQYSDYLKSFSDVALGLAPLCPETPFSRGKSFGKVLAYLDAGVPVLASDACEHGKFFTPETGVLSNDPAEWGEVMAELLCAPARRQTMSDAAFRQLEQRLSTEEAARRVDHILRKYLS